MKPERIPSSPFVRRSPRLALAWLALVLTGFPALAQEPAEEIEQDPALSEKLKVFDEAVRDRKMERDEEAVGIIDELLTQHQDGMHPKDEQSFQKSLEKVFTARQRKPDQPQLYAATVAALGKIGGPVSSRILVKLVDRKPFPDQDWTNLREQMFENIGRTKDERQVEFLRKRAVNDPVDQVKKAAGGALRHFEGSELRLRQTVFKELLVEYGRIYGDAHSSLDPGDALVATRKRTLNAIADTWNQTLAALSGQSFRTAEEWQHWWNKHKDDRDAWK
ncbi:MAG: hypothetical protein RL562_316 [Planctomycetota bacterium]|jgi:hypothetical protein